MKGGKAKKPECSVSIPTQFPGKTYHERYSLLSQFLSECLLFAKSNAVLARTSAFQLYGTVDHGLHRDFDFLGLLLFRTVVCYILMKVTVADMSFHAGI